MAEPTDDIVINLNNITRGEFDELVNASRAGRLDSDATARLVELVIESWPFDAPITREGFFDLGLIDSRAVEAALTNALNDLAKKN